MRMYFNEGMRGTAICKALPISRTVLYRWIANFAAENPEDATMRRAKEPANAPAIKSDSRDESMMPADVRELQAEVKRLRAQLTDAEIKAEVYDELINVAEAKFNIQIRKKAGAKQ